ncbi:MAG TPA: two-component regulator propeller domain-containing protein, partial [Parafilimonas sp.]|nr:two-component regulator propeller domain-containing protein [Parafilimonas sp.]
FKVTLLEPPVLIRADFHIKGWSPDLIYEFGEPFGNKSTTALFQDSNGFMWIGTEKGLYRYDGQNLFLYTQVPLAIFLSEDNEGQIWASMGNSNGICVINQKAGILKRLTTANGLANNSIARIVTDSQNRIWAVNFPDSDTGHFGINIIDEKNESIKWFDQGRATDNGDIRIFLDNQKNIWIANTLKGVKFIDLKSGKVKYINKNAGLRSDTTFRMFQDRRNRMWIAEIAQIDAIDIYKKTITHYDLGRFIPTAITGDDNGNIWVAATSLFNEPAGIKIISPDKKLLKTLNATNGLNSSEITNLYKDRQGQIWIAHNHGLNEVNTNNGSLLQHEGEVDVTDLKQDDAGRIWIGTLSGVWILDTTTKLVKIVNTKNGLSGNTVNSMYVVNDKICIVTDKGVDIADWREKTIKHFGRTEGLPGNPLLITAEVPNDNTNNIWLLTNDNPGVGVDVLDLGKNIVQHLNVDHDLRETSLTGLGHDRQGNIWLAYHTGGVVMIDALNKKISYFKDDPRMDEHYNKIVLGDAAGNVWIGTDKGIFVINAARDSLTKLSVNEGLISDRIISLNEHGGQIYAGTMGGITIITPPSSSNSVWKFQSFGRDQGIVKSGTGYSSDLITKDGKFLWGDKGITTLTANGSPRIQAKTEISGLSVFNQPQLFSNEPWTYLDEKDTLWGNRNSFYTGGSLPSSISIPNKGAVEFDSVSGYYNMPVNLSLPHDQNYLQFHFAQIHGNTSDTTWYRYILEGASKKWSDRTYLPVSENYLNLSPGNYTFKVSSFYNGVWTEPAEFSFEIRLPWWKNWWAYCLYAFALFTIVALAVQYRSRKLVAANVALEEKINRRTAELKQSLQDLKAAQTQLIQSEKMASLGELTAGIAHEIQNPLNFVNNFSEVNGELISELVDEVDKGNYEEVKVIAVSIKDNEEKIRSHGRRADTIVKGMLQHSRVSSGQKEPTDINALADEYLRLSYHGMRARDKSFNATLETDFDQSIGKINIVPQDIGRVLLNLFNNAFYAVCEKSKNPEGFQQDLTGSSNLSGQQPYVPRVTVVTKKLDNKILISITDNGPGMQQNIVDKIFQPFFTTKPTGEGTGLGLSLSYDIIKAHGGEIKVETKEAEGTEFIINLPV